MFAVSPAGTLPLNGAGGRSTVAGYIANTTRSDKRNTPAPAGVFRYLKEMEKN